MKLLALTRFGDLSASSRLRSIQYEPFFSQADIQMTTLPLFSNDDLAGRYRNGTYKIGRLISRYFSRAISLLKAKSDCLWIEKELIPWAPAWFEKFLLKGRPTVIDFDDAIFHNYDEHRIGIVRSLYGRKIDRLMKKASLVIAGNDYLADRARSAGCQNVKIVPTVIDLDRYPLSDGSHRQTDRSDKQQTIVGWIGSPYTTRYLPLLQQPLAELSKSHPIQFRVIGGRKIDFPGVDVKQLDWKEDQEVSMLMDCDMGVMPLPDSPFERGKCGYKLIQYMACGKPVVASPIGVNTQIVTPENGFLCETEEQWLEALRKLITDKALRNKMGEAGRQLVEEKYCVQQTAGQVIEYLKDIAQ